MKFINISKNENESNYHIFFNDDSTETKRTYLKEEDNVEKIKIILNCGFKSLKGLFSEFENNKQIVFYNLPIAYYSHLIFLISFNF